MPIGLAKSYGNLISNLGTAQPKKEGVEAELRPKISRLVAQRMPRASSTSSFLYTNKGARQRIPSMLALPPL
jgi:hypothetical protein